MKRIMWALAILIIPAFVIWGSGTSGKKREKGPDYAGKVFNRKVSFEEYQDMWQVTRDYATKTFGTEVDPELIDRLTWNRILLLEASKREDISVKDPEVVQRIASFPIFQKEGKFNKKLYKSILGENARAFEEKLRDDIRIFKLREKITSDISITDEEVRESYEKDFEKIKASYVSIPFADFSKGVLHQESDLVKYYEKNKETFRRPEEVNIKYIEIPSSKSDKAEELAYKVLDEAARPYALNINQTGFFNMQQEIPGIGWSYEFTKKSFQLKPGEISDVLIKTGSGFYIIQSKEKKSSYLPGFEEAKDSIKLSYIKNESIKLSEKRAKKVYALIINKRRYGKTFKAIAKQLKLEVKETDFITRDGYIPTLGPAREFVDESSSLKKEEISGPLKMLESWVILKLDEYVGIDEGKFLEEKESFKENLLSRKKEDTFNKWFEKFKKESDFVSYIALE